MTFAYNVNMGDRSTVLVVDDDPSLRLLCRVNLELEGYRVLEAGGVEEAQTALEAGRVDAILLDVHLGPHDGLALMPEIEARGSPVALLTGSPETHLPDGATVIGKPFSIENLTETVRRLVTPGS
ncbi:MAG: response regulator [Actinomycetota bacterium]|nr:response regulator [Actinomycetota bacterium]